MIKNALVVCTVGGFLRFEINDIKILEKLGYTVHIAANFTDFSDMLKVMEERRAIVHQINFARSPFSSANFQAYEQLKHLMKIQYFDIVHCHTPVGGVLARLCARKYRKQGTKVIYTAHGFHFYKGAPIMNWLLYYPVEKWMARYTDVLITINTEDYKWAEKKFLVPKIEYIPGVGIDIRKFQNDDIDELLYMKSLNIPEDCFILLSVGELNQNKNHSIVIKALGMLKEQKNIHYIIAGKGKLKEELSVLACRNGVEKQVHLLGYRKDIAELLQLADIYILPSYREGLNVSLMEAMASALPCIVSDIRGNRDLIDEEGGILCNPYEESEFINAIELLQEKGKRENMGQYNFNKIKAFSKDIVNSKMQEIYSHIILD